MGGRLCETIAAIVRCGCAVTTGGARGASHLTCSSSFFFTPGLDGAVCGRIPSGHILGFCRLCCWVVVGRRDLPKPAPGSSRRVCSGRDGRWVAGSSYRISCARRSCLSCSSVSFRRAWRRRSPSDTGCRRPHGRAGDPRVPRRVTHNGRIRRKRQRSCMTHFSIYKRYNDSIQGYGATRQGIG